MIVNRFIWIWLVAIFILVPKFALAQDENPKWEVKGYLKEMATFGFFRNDTLSMDSVDNLVHSRINLAWYPSQNWTARLEVRTRVFSGDTYRSIPGYSQLVDTNNDYFDLSWVPIAGDKVLIHSMIDRASVQWHKNDWEVTLGRQRLNWGVNLAWNPNDLFNSYSFFDFDYEERPGSDALRVRKYTGVASEMEFAIKAADSFEELTSAFKYQINKWNYDIQFIGGVMKNNLALGTGWAGSIGGAGFKGELTYLNDFDNVKNGLLTSVSFDYLFSNSIYLNGSVLYNSYGGSEPVFGAINTTSSLDIRSISQYKWSSFATVSYPVHPLINISLAAIAFPSDGSFFINPVLNYSIVENLDLDAIGQLYFAGEYSYNALFARLKWSF